MIKSSCFMTIHKSMDEINKNHWDHLTNSLDMNYSYEWMQHIVAVYPENLLIFSIYNQNKKLVAFSCGFNGRDNLPYFYHPKELFFSEQFLRLKPNDHDLDTQIQLKVKLTDLFNRYKISSDSSISFSSQLNALKVKYTNSFYPTIIFRNGYTSSIIVDQELSIEQQNNMKKLMLDYISDYAKENGYKSITFLYGSKEDHEIYKEKNYKKTLISGNLQFDTSDFSSFQDYLITLPSKRRSEVKREIKRFNEKKIIKKEIDLNNHIEEVSQLELNNLSKYGNSRSLSKIMRGKAELVSTFGNNLITFGYYLEDTLVASLVTVTTGDYFNVLSIGIDYEKTENSFAYLNIVFYEALQHAIENNIKYVSFGPEAFEVKLRRGAELVDLYTYIEAINDKEEPFLVDFLKIFNKSNSIYLNNFHYKFDRKK